MLVTALNPQDRLRQRRQGRQEGPQGRHHAEGGGAGTGPAHGGGVRPVGAARAACSGRPTEAHGLGWVWSCAMPARRRGMAFFSTATSTVTFARLLEGQGEREFLTLDQRLASPISITCRPPGANWAWPPGGRSTPWTGRIEATPCASTAEVCISTERAMSLLTPISRSPPGRYCRARNRRRHCPSPRAVPTDARP